MQSSLTEKIRTILEAVEVSFFTVTLASRRLRVAWFNPSTGWYSASVEAAGVADRAVAWHIWPELERGHVLVRRQRGAGDGAGTEMLGWPEGGGEVARRRRLQETAFWSIGEGSERQTKDTRREGLYSSMSRWAGGLPWRCGLAGLKFSVGSVISVALSP
jgi:hypothetical protein